MEKNIKCKCCGKLFEYDKKRASRSFCDEECRKKYYGIYKKIIEIRKCLYCGKEFECSSSTPSKKYCSKECLSAVYKKKAEQKKKEIIQKIKDCEFCGKEFNWISTKPTQKYCCEECQKNATWERVHKEIFKEERQCENCEKMYIWFSNKPNQKYCSTECLHQASYKSMLMNKKSKDEFLAELRSKIYLQVSELIGKMNEEGNSFNNQYIDYWNVGDISEKTREEVLKRDCYECKICMRKDSLHLHHLIKRRDGGNHNTENLITLCASCHRHIETGDIEHATNKCFKNAKIYYHMEVEKVERDLEYVVCELESIFHKLKILIKGETEILSNIDDIIDILAIDESDK